MNPDPGFYCILRGRKEFPCAFAMTIDIKVTFVEIIFIYIMCLSFCGHISCVKASIFSSRCHVNKGYTKIFCLCLHEQISHAASLVRQRIHTLYFGSTHNPWCFHAPLLCEPSWCICGPMSIGIVHIWIVFLPRFALLGYPLLGHQPPHAQHRWFLHLPTLWKLSHSNVLSHSRNMCPVSGLVIVHSLNV